MMSPYDRAKHNKVYCWKDVNACKTANYLPCWDVTMNEDLQHPYIGTSPLERRKMLKEISLTSEEELFVDIPQSVALNRNLDLPGPLTEYELLKEFNNLLKKNITTTDCISFLGGGITDLHVPAVVEEILGRGEFYTSYTPYQAEISQGMLQALFEYQSLIAELTEMEVVNSSMYDWATALGEACTMTARITKRNKFAFVKSIAPNRLAVLKNYALGPGIKLVEIDFDPQTGMLDLISLKTILNDDTAGVYIENPNFYGVIEEDIHTLIDEIHRVGALAVVGVDPLSLGIIEPPGAYGADIVIGEGQALGNKMNFGGPLLGIFAIQYDRRQVTQFPGRLIGLTTEEASDQPAFCMTLQTREQHIRRERATSNICTNQALNAVASAVYLSLLGIDGLKELGRGLLGRAHYLAKQLDLIDQIIAPFFKAPFFREFCIGFEDPSLFMPDKFEDYMLEHKILGGIPVSSKGFHTKPDALLISVSEKHSKIDLNLFVKTLAGYIGGT